MNMALDQQSIAATMDALGESARVAAGELARCDSDQRDAALKYAAAAIRAQNDAILSAEREGYGCRRGQRD